MMMTMFDGGMLFFTLMFGLILGLIFFGGLWWTVRRMASSRQPVLLFLLSGLLRMATVVLGFYMVSGGYWQRLAMCLLGFVLARLMVTYMTRDFVRSGAVSALEDVHHAPQP